MIHTNANVHIEGWYKGWLPKASTHELQRLLGSDYGKDPDVAPRLKAELSRRDETGPCCPLRVKSGKARTEHFMSAFHPIATKQRTQFYVGSVPTAEVTCALENSR
jgi:hypothetical protein